MRASSALAAARSSAVRLLTGRATLCQARSRAGCQSLVVAHRSAATAAPCHTAARVPLRDGLAWPYARARPTTTTCELQRRCASSASGPGPTQATGGSASDTGTSAHRTTGVRWRPWLGGAVLGSAAVAAGWYVLESRDVATGGSGGGSGSGSGGGSAGAAWETMLSLTMIGKLLRWVVRVAWQLCLPHLLPFNHEIALVSAVTTSRARVAG